MSEKSQIQEVREPRRVRHHVNPLADQTEISWEGFGNARPVIVDIGADHGEFTAGLLERFGATHNFVVCEIRKPLARRLTAQFAAHDNVRVFDGDANRNFRNILAPCLADGAIIETIYVNFPDPWFKKRHHKRRFVRAVFLQEVAVWLPEQVAWVFQTDQAELFAETCDMLDTLGVGYTHFDAAPHGVATKWERAKIKAGVPIARIKFTLDILR